MTTRPAKDLLVTHLPPAAFQGVVPAIIATSDAEGTPNATYLSQVFLIDDRHVALSCQFFNKTKRNVLENPHACVFLHDPLTFETFRLYVKYLRAETTGPLFDRMSARIEAIASHTGMSGIFKLLSADVYEVTSIEAIEDFLEPAPAEPPTDEPIRHRNELASLQLVSVRASRATDLEGLLSGVLQALHEGFGFEHSMVLLLDESSERLTAIASHGYGDAGVGAEVRVGEGLIGTVARERCVLRVMGVGQELRYGRAIRATVHRQAGPRALRPEIPLPGLVDAQSQMAMPLIVGDRLIGVIAVESRSLVAFDAWHEAYLDIVGNQVAVAIDNMMDRDRETEVEPAPSSDDAPVVSSTTPSMEEPAGRVLRFRFYEGDDCVFAGDDYLIRNIPGRILWRLLRAYESTGRTDFSNRELRLDPTLGLPAIRDNLESRLVLLRKRLAQKCPDVKLVSTGRGLFRLELGCKIVLEDG
ncbi:MAG: GAF sensor protein [Myxococcales bacterium 68-20]|nr:MAG: GAF sensor protein [Myxococcales bacterium 68-20]